MLPLTPHLEEMVLFRLALFVQIAEVEPVVDQSRVLGELRFFYLAASLVGETALDHVEELLVLWVHVANLVLLVFEGHVFVTLRLHHVLVVLLGDIIFFNLSEHLRVLLLCVQFRNRFLLVVSVHRLVAPIKNSLDQPSYE